MLPLCLTIAGSDPAGGAGIQLDLAVFRSLGVYGMSVISVITAQTASRVYSASPVSNEQFSRQLQCLSSQYQFSAIKIGILDPELIETLKNFLSQASCPVILDPVLKSSSGHVFLDAGRFSEVIPLVTLITPNVPEAELLSSKSISSLSDMITASELILSCYSSNGGALKGVLVKGSHLGKEKGASDVFSWLDESGDVVTEIFSTCYKELQWEVHGTGCFLSSAITALVANGADFSRAIKESKELIESYLAKSVRLPGDKSGVFVFFD
ncbi:MAG TPA: hydroxymethylpyrimidine/phosphomethylpyrimidine kinase [Oligoflexia bacterium]|nr:hydroxymethylpyrimidine/phosphomethylpyrimidine kinase [Oligoflexia bacterium]HMP49266.1 hydroxymethylpyrimidine/phosphomethylpyrimidine kinase [Oligoflexia bacterium]